MSWSKEGGVVYFSDTQGHVLSLTFQLKDTRARGLKRWFSIVVLMKDKMLLLNLMPVLSEHMQVNNYLALLLILTVTSLFGPMENAFLH